MSEISPLRRRMTEDMTVRNLSPATQQSYISGVSKFSRFFGRSPDLLDLEDVRTFQVHLVAKGISWPGLNQIVCALRFFYGVTLRCDEIPERIAGSKSAASVQHQKDGGRSHPLDSMVPPAHTTRTTERPVPSPPKTPHAWSSSRRDQTQPPKISSASMLPSCQCTGTIQN